MGRPTFLEASLEILGLVVLGVWIRNIGIVRGSGHWDDKQGLRVKTLSVPFMRRLFFSFYYDLGILGRGVCSLASAHLHCNWTVILAHLLLLATSHWKFPIKFEKTP